MARYMKYGIELDTYIVVDIETTGFSQRHDEIIEIAAVKVIDNQIADSFTKLIKSITPIPLKVQQLTKITSEMLIADGEEIKDVLYQFKEFIGDRALLGHNINFDMGFINSNFLKYYGDVIHNDYFDTLPFIKEVLPDLSNHKLQYIAYCLNTSPESKHRALGDCITLNNCYQKLKNMKSKDFAKINDDNNKLLIENGDIVAEVFKNKTVVVTGELDRFTRTETQSIIERSGGVFGLGITMKTNYLIVGDIIIPNKNSEKSTKQLKADEYISKGVDIRILTQYEFYNLINSETVEDDEFDDIQNNESNIIVIINELFYKLANSKDFPEMHKINNVGKGFSYFCYGTKMFSYFKLKSKEYMEFSTSDIRNFDTLNLTTEEKNSLTRIYVDEETDKDNLFALLSHVHNQCDMSTPSDFDCCSRYKECSRNKRCINEVVTNGFPLGLNCGYRKKLNKGIVFDF